MRFYKRINDVFEVEAPDGKRYFQYLQSDSSLLGGNIIAIFNNKYDKSELPSIDDIAKGPVEYYCHTNINYGVELGLWKKYGNTPAHADLSKIPHGDFWTETYANTYAKDYYKKYHPNFAWDYVNCKTKY